MALAELHKLNPDTYAAEFPSIIRMATEPGDVGTHADQLLSKMESEVVSVGATKLLLGGASVAVEVKALALLERLGLDALAAHADAIAHLLSMEELKYVWRIEEFSAEGEGRLNSPTFSSGNHSWCAWHSRCNCRCGK